MKMLVVGVIVMGIAGVCSTPAHSQERTVELRLINGKDGNPIGNARVLGFLGANNQEIRRELHKLQVETDVEGKATLRLNMGTTLLQLWPEDYVLCAPTFNNTVFETQAIAGNGVRSENTCSARTSEISPGTLVVFVRPLTFREKMRR